MQINISYDQSQGNLPAGFVTAVNYVVNYFDTTFTNNVTVNIDLGYGEIAGQSLGSGALGESETYFNSVGYSQAVNALNGNAPSATQQAAYSTLPGSSPVGGGTLWVSTAEEKTLGLLAGNNSAIDGYIGLSSTYPFSYSASATPASGQYYFDGVLAHEISEVLGRGSLLGDALGTGSYSIMDLFRYAAPGARQLGTGGPAFFSINNGTTNLNSWNTNPSGDLGDWAGSAGTDSFLAFSPSGQVDWITQPDLTLMNVLGWDTTSAPPPSGPPSITVVDQTVAPSQSVALASIFSVSGGVTQYHLFFSNPSGGSPALGTIALNGTPVVVDQTVTLSSLSGLTYTGGTTSGIDKIWLQAFNGNSASNLAEADITDQGNGLPPPPPSGPPSITVVDRTVAPSQSVALTSLFSVSGGVTQYHLFFSNPSGGSPALGTIALNGTPVAVDQTVTLSSLSGLTYTGGTTSGIDKIWLQAFNGSGASNLAEADISDPGSATAQPGTDGSLNATLSLFSSYMASSFATPIDSHSAGGITSSSPFFSDQNAPLARPQHA